MKSTIKIDFADLFGDGIEPMIKVHLVDTDDPRDKLLKTLFQSTGSYLQIQYSYSNNNSGMEPWEDIFLFKPKNEVVVGVNNDVSDGFNDIQPPLIKN